MDDLTREQAESLRAALVELGAELEEYLESSREGARPVDLDQPIGRLSRMDALQRQQLVIAERAAHGRRLELVHRALAAHEAGRYGACCRCEEPIGVARLQARPEAPLCLACQEEVDERR